MKTVWKNATASPKSKERKVKLDSSLYALRVWGELVYDSNAFNFEI